MATPTKSREWLSGTAAVIRDVLRAVDATAGADLRATVLPRYIRERDRWVGSAGRERQLPEIQQEIEWWENREGRTWTAQERKAHFRKRARMEPLVDSAPPIFHQRDWPPELRDAVRDCAGRAYLVRKGVPPQWWWDDVEMVLHFWALGTKKPNQGLRDKPLGTGMIQFSQRELRLQNPDYFRWWVAIHVHGERQVDIADREHCAPERISIGYQRVCRMLGIDKRPRKVKEKQPKTTPQHL